MIVFHRFPARLLAALVLGLLTNVAVAASNKIGVFELIHQPSATYVETVQAVADALQQSNLSVHAQHEIRVPEQKQKAHVFVLTSPEYRALAKEESPRTVSAQVLRVAVYSWGDDQKTLINMANPVPHAMLFYAGSDNYDDLVAGAGRAAADIRNALSSIPGESVSKQQSPERTEKHYRKFKGDGPARMMAKFRTFRKSQLEIHSSTTSSVAEMAKKVAATLAKSTAEDVSEPDGWETLVQIPFGEDAVYIGLSNPYIEDKMIRINSRFRSDGKSDKAPYPGVDHVAALPTEVLVVRDDGETKVLHYGQMWRMQLYFWDSGYRAFTVNVGVPSSISNSIEDIVAAGLE